MLMRSCAVLALVWGAAANAAPTPPTIAIVGATVIDGNGGPPLSDGVILLKGDRIAAVGPRSSVAIPRGARQVDARGKWVTPGLIDAHVHFSQSGGLYTRPDAFDLRAAVPYKSDFDRSRARLDDTFARYLASGVTTVVDAGGPLWNYEVRRRAMASTRAPRVAVAGPLIATEPAPETARMNLGDPLIISAADTTEARRLAAAQLVHKPDFIKIWGIGSGPAGAARVRDMTRAVAEVAHAAGVRVAVHATDLVIAEAAVEGGADILVHTVEDTGLTESLVAMMKQRGVVMVSTAMALEGYEEAALGNPQLSTIERTLGAPDIIASLNQMPAATVARAAERMPPTTVRQILQNARTMVKAGARFAVGTDAGNVGSLHGPSIHREMQLLSRGGLTPLQIITAATRDAAFVYSPKPDIGLIATGYRADLLLLDADPLKSVANLGRIRQVWVRGEAIDPATLLPPTPETIVQRQLERYNAHDLEGFAATYSDDVQIFDAVGATRPWVSGKAQLRAEYGKLFRDMPDLQCRSAQRMVEGNMVIDQEICTMRADRPPLSGAAIYEVKDNLIRRVWFALSPA